MLYWLLGSVTLTASILWSQSLPVEWTFVCTKVATIIKNKTFWKSMVLFAFSITLEILLNSPSTKIKLDYLGNKKANTYYQWGKYYEPH